MDYRYYASQLQRARHNYDRSRDHNAYMTDCAFVALQIAAQDLGTRDPRLKHLSTGLSAAQWGIKGVIDMIAENLSCPIERGHNHEAFLTEFSQHGKRFMERDLQVVKDILRYIGM